MNLNENKRAKNPIKRNNRKRIFDKLDRLTVENRPKGMDIDFYLSIREE